MIIKVKIRISDEMRGMIGYLNSGDHTHLCTEQEVVDYVRIALAKKLANDEFRYYALPDQIMEVPNSKLADDVEWEVIE